MNISIEGKTIVISGGTKGVGKLVVQRCTEEGANVVFGGRDRDAAADLLESIRQHVGEGIFVQTDVIKARDCQNLFDVAAERFGKVDGFLNYAGITPSAELESCNEEMLDAVMDTNFRAAFLCCRCAVTYMKQSGGGSIILVGSPHAWAGDKDRAAYACSKGALLTLSNHIALHYAADNIRCNYLTLGWTLTEGEIELRKAQVEDVEAYFREAAHLIPMKRLCTPEDYIEQIVYLFSDASKMMTGTILEMTAGYFLRGRR